MAFTALPSGHVIEAHVRSSYASLRASSESKSVLSFYALEDVAGSSGVKGD